MKLLIIESDTSAARMLEVMLSAEGFQAWSAESGEEGISLAKIYTYDAIILDLDLDDMDGIAVLRTLRGAKVLTPVVALSRSSGVEAEVQALSVGADDFITRPFHRDVLVGRLHAVIRRSAGHAESRLCVGPISIDLHRKVADIGDTRITFTGMEYKLVEALALRKGATLSKDALLDALYGGRDEPDIKIIDVFVCKVRNKLKPFGAAGHVQTIWGRGYALMDIAVDWPNAGAAPRPARLGFTTPAGQLRRKLQNRLLGGPATLPNLAAIAPDLDLIAILDVMDELIAEGRVRNIGTPTEARFEAVEQAVA